MDQAFTITSRAADFLAAFVPLITLAGIAVILEIVVPWREGKRADGLHWMQSVVLLILGTLLTRLVLPLSIFTAGIWAAERGIGLFNVIEAPYWLAFAVSILGFDLVDYCRHRMFHSSDLLWRAHRVHHSDEEITTSTALRFHPLEAVFTVAGHVGIALLFGAPPFAAIVFAVMAMIFDIWEHANVRTPRWVRHLEILIITPGMHRYHHGCGSENIHSNFGTVFSIWDRMFGSFQSSAALSEDARFGLGPKSRLRFDTLGALLGDPARKG